MGMAGRVTLDRDALIKALMHLEVIVPSLDRIGSSAAIMSEEEYQKALSEFIQDWDVGPKLAEVRRILSEPFGDDDLEQIFDEIETWELTHRKPQAH
jgi:hypothetical protein